MLFKRQIDSEPPVTTRFLCVSDRTLHYFFKFHRWHHSHRGNQTTLRRTPTISRLTRKRHLPDAKRFDSTYSWLEVVFEFLIFLVSTAICDRDLFRYQSQTPIPKIISLENVCFDMPHGAASWLIDLAHIFKMTHFMHWLRPYFYLSVSGQLLQVPRVRRLFQIPK